MSISLNKPELWLGTESSLASYQNFCANYEEKLAANMKLSSSDSPQSLLEQDLYIKHVAIVPIKGELVNEDIPVVLAKLWGMHLLVVRVGQDEVAALYPDDFSASFSIGLFSKTPAQEIYVIFSEADYVDIQIQIYSKRPATPIYPGYGIETFRTDGSKTFTFQNPPLLPVFVSNSGSINSIPSSSYKLGCVFSRVDTFVYGRKSGSTACCVFNGINWVHGSKWASSLMGFTGGGEWNPSDKSRQFSFTMGTLDSNTWDWMASRDLNSKEGAYVKYSLPVFAKDRGITKEDLEQIGVFMGVVMY